MIDAKPSDLAFIKTTIHKYLPEVSLWVFGSRIKGTASASSDLDLVLKGVEKIDLKILFHIKTDFQESSLPFRIDVLDWNAISPHFQNLIKVKYEIL